jgi:hypothetical protein
LRWWVYLIGGVAALFAFAVGLAFIRVDATRVAGGVAAALEQRLGQPVALGDVDLQLLPVPTVRARDVQIGAGDGREPFLRAGAVRLEVSLLGLLAGQVALGSVAIDGPHLSLEIGADGLPVLPTREPGGVEPSEGAVDAPRLWITDVEVRDGTAEIGPWKLADFALDGGAALDLGAGFDFSALLLGLGSIRNGRVELSNLVDGPIAWSVRADVGDLDVMALREIVAPERAVWGTANGQVEAGGTGLFPSHGTLRLALTPLDVRMQGVTVSGDVDLAAELGGGWSVDLSKAEIQFSDQLTKPIGVAARVSAPLPRSFWPDRLADLRIAVGERELRGAVQLRGGTPVLELAGELDLASLKPGRAGPPLPQRGLLRFDRATFRPPSMLQAEGSVEGVEVDLAERFAVLGEGKLALDGGWAVEGSLVEARDLGLGFAGQQVRLTGDYDFVTRQFQLRAEADGVDVAAISERVSGTPMVTGRLYARLEAAGTPELESIAGHGSFEIPGGEFLSLSLEEFLLEPGAPSTGVKTFQRIAGEFEVKELYAEFSRLVLEQSDTVAVFFGSWSLADGRIDLDGDARVLVRDEVLERALRVNGTFAQPIAQLRDRSAAVRADRRLQERTVLEAMRQMLEERGAPEEPEAARTYRLQLSNIQRQLRQNLERDKRDGR